MRYEGLYWSDELDLSVIKKQLRVYGVGHTSPIIFDAWKESDGELGVPIQWAKARGLAGDDLSVYPHYDWPEFNASYKDDQESCINKMVAALNKKGGALLEAPTGWGKTVAAISIASRMNTPTLVLVHKQDLVDQWRNTATKFFGVESGVVQQDNWDYEHPLTIAMIKTLDSRVLPEDFKSRFGLVISDEGHHVPCKTFSSVIGELPARYRMGVSATWRRRDGLESVWEWHIGKVEAKGKRKPIAGKFYQISVKAPISDEKFTRRGNINHSALVTAISESLEMNHAVIQEIRKALDKDRNILVVSHRVSQLEYLLQFFPDAGIYAGSFKGKTKTPAELEAASKKQLILATFSKVSEGTDIPRLDTLIMATPCGDPEQVVGRITRDFPDKKQLVITDLFVPTSYNFALANKRKRIYETIGLAQG